MTLTSLRTVVEEKNKNGSTGLFFIIFHKAYAIIVVSIDNKVFGLRGPIPKGRDRNGKQEDNFSVACTCYAD